jgi:predicted helicase
MYDFSRDRLTEKVQRFIEAYNAEVDRWKRRKDKKVEPDQFVGYDDSRTKWSEALKLNLRRERYVEFSEAAIRQSLYRPFSRRLLYFDPICNEKPRLFAQVFPGTAPERENSVVCVPGQGNRTPFGCLAASGITSLDLAFEKCQCFPLYTYSVDGTHRRDNVADWALDQFRSHYRNPGITKQDIFHYVYAVLHHPDYRARFADNLKRELPRIPFAPDFRSFAEAGRKLARRHLDYEKLDPHPLEYVESLAVPLSFKVVDKMRLSKDRRSIVVNPSLTLHGIPEEAFGYRLGNRSALEWVIDQYQVTEDKRSGIRSDANLWSEDERYIVRLVGQVVRVSLETLAIVGSLPSWWKE